MQDLCFPTSPATRLDRPLAIDADPFAAPAGTRLIPGGRIARMRDAAMRGDLDALRVQTVAMRGDINLLRNVADGGTPDQVIEALERFGIDAGRVAGDIIQYIALARSAVSLINALLAFSNAFTNLDTEVTTFAFPLEEGIQPVAAQLGASVAKENKGLVFLDNDEAITRVRATFEVLTGPPVATLTLFVRLRAFGVGQDAMIAPLRVTDGDGVGNPNPVAPVTSEIDTAGLEISQQSVFIRNNTSKLTVSLAPAPGRIDYGINGANVALALEVSGVAQYPFGTIGLNRASAVDIGLSA